MQEATLPSNRGLSQLIVPHRSYRILPVTRASALRSVPLVLLIEVIVAIFAQRALDAMATFGSFVAAREGIAVRPFADQLPYIHMQPMAFAMRHSDWIELLVVIAACVVTVVVLSVWKRLAAPIVLFVNLNALVIGGAAVYLLLTGHLGYDSGAFSALLLRTALFTWLVMPLFVGLLASLFPLSIGELVAFLVLSVAYDVPLSIVRYGLFVALLGRTSSIVMTDLYLVFGPLLDAIPIVCLFGILLTRVARRLRNDRAAWQWL